MHYHVSLNHNNPIILYRINEENFPWNQIWEVPEVNQDEGWFQIESNECAIFEEEVDEIQNHEEEKKEKEKVEG